MPVLGFVLLYQNKIKEEMKMNEYKFFDPNGNVIEAEGGKSARERFVDFYSDCYYSDGKNQNPIKGVNKTCRSEEENIERILRADTIGETDLVDILCWKTGGKLEDGVIRGRNTSPIPMALDDERSILSKLNDLNEKTKRLPIDEKQAIDILRLLLDARGIGPVYAITILYFGTKGQYPIYDKYAHVALKKIADTRTGSKEEFNSLISDSEWKDEFDTESLKNAEEIFERYCTYYVNRLNEIFFDGKQLFGRESITDRSYDQALWVYGHLFNETSTNEKRSEGSDSMVM